MGTTDEKMITRDPSNTAIFRSDDESQNLFLAIIDAVAQAKGLGEFQGSETDLDEWLGDQKDDVVELVKRIHKTWCITGENRAIDERSAIDMEEGIEVESGFGATSKRPFVRIKIEGQYRPEHARELALGIMDAATVSEDDGMILRWMEEHLEMTDMNQQHAMMQDMRKFRSESRIADNEEEPDTHIAEVRTGKPPTLRTLAERGFRA